MQMACQSGLHWGTGYLLGVMRAMDWPVGMGNQSMLPNQAWSGQRWRVWAEAGFSEFLSLVFNKVLCALLYLRWNTNNELLCSTENSTKLYDNQDGRGVFGTRIPRYIWLSSFFVHLKLRILLTSYTPIQNKGFFFKKVQIVVMQEENQHSLQRNKGAGVRRKETGSEESNGRTCSFLNNFIEVWLIFIVALSYSAQQCDSVIHINIYIFLFFFMWFITEYWI